MSIQGLPGADRLTAVREEQVIPVEAQALVGGLLAIERLETTAEEIGGSR